MIDRLRRWFRDLAAGDRAKVVMYVALGVFMAWLPLSGDIRSLEPILRWWISGAAVLSVISCGGMVLRLAEDARVARLAEEEAEAHDLAALTDRARQFRSDPSEARRLVDSAARRSPPITRDVSMAESGVVLYTIESDTKLGATWCFSDLEENVPGTGTAVGDTSGGFPGDYSITYERPDGTTEGPFLLRIQGHGKVLRLEWLQGSELRFTGVGFEIEGGLVATYAPVVPR